MNLNLLDLSFGKSTLLKDYFDYSKQYFKEYGPKCIVLMQVGSFFEVYGLKSIQTDYTDIVGSNITDFSRICELNVVDKNVCAASLQSHTIVMAGFKDFMLEKYVRKLQENYFTSIVFIQEPIVGNETPKRSLYAIYSPGTFFSNEVSQITNNTLCVWINVVDTFLTKTNNTKRIYIGSANINIYTGKSTLFEFNETYINNPTTFDELERFVSIYNPNEAIIIANLSEHEIDNIINYANIHCSCVHKISTLAETTIKISNCEKQTYQKQLLERFYNIVDYNIFMTNFNDNIIATQAFCYLLDFIYSHNPNLIYKISEPEFENCNERLILTNHSLKQLNIIDVDGYSGKFSSVLNMCNQCITSMGKRTFTSLFLNPTTNIEYLTQEYETTDYLLRIPFENIRKILTPIKDISKIERQIMCKKIEPKTIYHLFQNIETIMELYYSIAPHSFIQEYLTNNIFYFSNLLDYCQDLKTFLETHFIISKIEDLDNVKDVDLNFIQPGVSLDLDTQIQTLFNSNAQIESCCAYLNSIVATYEKKSKTQDYVKIHETEKNNFSLIATDRRCKILKTALKNIPETVQLSYISYSGEKLPFALSISESLLEFNKQTSSNNSISTPQINQLLKNITSVKLKMKETISSVYQSIIHKLENYTSHFKCIIEFVTKLDIILSKALVAKRYNYVKPVIDLKEKAFVNVKDLRHCLIEQLSQNELYVANDVELGQNNPNGILLYGTNAVGKTSLIRALGIAVIMAQSGLYVPASSFHYSPYKYIFTRILGNDNIFKGLSTFAVEMSELRTILKSANSNSLILGDELCSGTENISAISIFVAGIQQLHKINCSFIFATHLHEIVNYSEITELSHLALKHMSVCYDLENGRLIYDRKMKDGPGDNMYGLEVCKSLSLPPAFLELAHQIRMKYYPVSTNVLSLKTSNYNANKIKGVCEKCKKELGTEVHHLLHQQQANKDGFIHFDSHIFHKNHLANLVNLCNKCHDEFHHSKKLHKKIKTSEGFVIQEI